MKRLLPIIVLLLLAGCVQETPTPENGGEDVQFANPAAVYCEEQGGVIENEQTELGAHGICKFQDGSECGQWDYLNDKCNKGDCVEVIGSVVNGNLVLECVEEEALEVKDYCESDSDCVSICGGCYFGELPTCGAGEMNIVDPVCECENQVCVKADCPDQCCAEGMYKEKACAAGNCVSGECVVATDPVDEFDDALIASLGIDCSEGNTDYTKAQCIKTWQEENMFYCRQSEIYLFEFFSEYHQCDWAERANEIKPGSYPASKVVQERVKNERVYGLSQDFATTFCSIARYYDVDCRVLHSETLNSITPEETECNAQTESFWAKAGLDVSCDEWLSYANQGPKHYWAEVRINKIWEIYEASQAQYYKSTQITFKDEADFKITDW